MIKTMDLQATNAVYAEELKQVAAEVIDKGWFLLGERVKAFEQQYASIIGCKHTIACANCLDALRIIVRAYMEMGKLKEGDEVIVAANTYIASVLAITDNRLIPVLAPPHPVSHNLDLGRLEESITPRTRAVMVVHLYGQVCWGEELEAFAEKHNLIVIEDNAQAFGASLEDGRFSGNLGHAAGHSFYPSKNLGALGDAGAITTNDDTLAQTCRTLANYGSAVRYVNQYAGYNSRMDELQAAFLNIKLKYIFSENNRRREIAEAFCQRISHPDIMLPALYPSSDRNIAEVASHVWHLFVVRTQKREQLAAYLLDNGIQTQIHYPIPPHRQQCYSGQSPVTGAPFIIHSGAKELAERLADEVLSLPISPVMTPDEVEHIIQTLNSWQPKTRF